MTHRGVLIPAELRSADVSTLDQYASSVKAGNAAFVRACFALEDAAARIGLTMDDLEDAS